MNPYLKPAHTIGKVEFRMTYMMKNKKELFELIMGSLDTNSPIVLRMHMWCVQHKHLMEIANL